MIRTYTPPTLLGIWQPRTVDVEVLVLDYDSGTARVRMPLAPSSVMNIIRRRNGLKSIDFVVRDVPLDTLSRPRDPEAP